MIGNKQAVQEYLQDKKEDVIFEITQKREKSLVSRAQQKYYFGVIVDIISNFHGNTPIETHEILKVTTGLETTTNLEKSDFSFMCNLIRDLWKTKFDVYIPLPNEADLGELEKYLF